MALYIEPSGPSLADLARVPANPPAALALVTPFASLPIAELVAADWLFDGHWLHHLQPADGSRPAVVHSAPLSTCALAEVAAQTLKRPGGC